MKPKIFLPTLMWLLSLAIVADAQESAQSEGMHCYARPVEHPSVYSPQTTAMMRYDNPGVNLNTGTVSLTIPLLEFNDPDFDVDLSMTYSMDGFKPLVPDNYVGMGWHLNCGGVITREVHGIPDEFMGFPAAPTLYGYEAMVNGYMSDYVSSASALLSADSLWLNSHLRQTPVGSNGNWEAIVFKNGPWTELSPDIFHFSFGKHSGMFIMDGDEVLVSSDTGCGYKVEFMEFTRRPSNQNSDNVPMRIKITTDDGYQYFFGGDYSTIEYTALRWSDITIHGIEADTTSLNFPPFELLQSNVGYRYNEPVAFHLSKVISPNGRELTYEYADWVPDNVHEEPEMLILSHSRLPSNGLDNMLKSYIVTPELIPMVLEDDAEKVDLRYSLTKTALLKSIYSDTQRIDFTFGSHACPFFCFDRHIDSGNDYDHGRYNYLSQCGARLESVSLRCAGNPVQKTELSYKSNESRLFLSCVDNSREGKFTLSYYPCNMTKSLTIDIDKWGFWNGFASNTYFQPEETLSIDWNRMEYRRVYGDRNREPSGTDYTANMLSKVIFPTGGSVSYEYQPHDYSRFYEQSYETLYIPEIRETSSSREIAGGARLFKEVYDDGMNREHLRTKVYEYSTETGRSSGLLKAEGNNYLGMYVVAYSFIEGTDVIVPYPSDYTLTYSPLYFGKYILRNNGIGGYIEYSQVTEYDHDESLINFSPDSVFRKGVSSLDDIPVSGTISVSVGTHGQNEHLSEWTFSGASNKSSRTSSSFVLKDINGMTLLERTFGPSKENIRIYPLEELGAGKYEISYMVGKGSQFMFEAKYPNIKKLEHNLPRKTSCFSDTPLVYEGRSFHPFDIIDNYFFYIGPEYYEYADIFLHRYYSKPVNYSRQGGHLLSEQEYDAAGRLRREVKIDYQTSRCRDAATVNHYPMIPDSKVNYYYQIERIPVYSTLPAFRTITEYDEYGRSFETRESYMYNSNGRLRTSTLHDPDNGTLSTTYTYPSDYDDEVSRTMVSRNILSPVIEYTVYKDSAEIIYKSVSTYTLIENNEHPDPQMLPVPESFGKTYGGDPVEPEVEYLSYDIYGNPVMAIEKGVEIMYIWGYEGKHLIGKIENVSEEEVLDALNIDSVNDISMAMVPDEGIFGQLRSLIPHAKVYSYTYIPGIGISSETWPDGFTLYYDYDESCRLSSIYYLDDDGTYNLVKKFKYQLVNE